MNSTPQLSPAVTTGVPYFDWLLMMQRTMLDACSTVLVQPFAVASSRPAAAESGADVEVIQLGQEMLNVGTRVVRGDTTIVRRAVVEEPAERQVTLREERVIVERRKPATAGAGHDVLGDKEVAMTETTEMPVVWKSTRLNEEIVLRKAVTERTQTVRDTVRRDTATVTTPQAGRDAARATTTVGTPALITDPAEIVRPLAAAAATSAADTAMPVTMAALHAQEEAAKRSAVPPAERRDDGKAQRKNS